jgi:hypothetical protein
MLGRLTSHCACTRAHIAAENEEDYEDRPLITVEPDHPRVHHRAQDTRPLATHQSLTTMPTRAPETVVNAHPGP